jgi:hypothetical protein
MKLLKLKKAESKDLIEILQQDKFKEVLKQIIKVHKSNSAIMTNITFIIYNLLEYVDLDDILEIISFSILKDIFLNFQLNGFDVIHEAIIYLIKGILVKNSSLGNDKSILTDKDYNHMVHVFYNSLLFIKNKIAWQTMDMLTLSRSLFNFITHIYTITNILNNINSTNAEQTYKTCVDVKFAEQLIDCLFVFQEKKIFTFVETGFDKYDVALINTKAIIFRALYHCVSLIKRFVSLENNGIVISLFI